MRRLPVFLILALGPVLVPVAQAATPAESGAAVGLVDRLGSSQYREREEASRALEVLGTSALPALRSAVDDPDLEKRRRVRELVGAIERKADAAAVLSARPVHLDYKDVSLLSAVADFKRQTGLALQLAGDRATLGRRRITLDTGETTPWHALDLLCRQAGLMESGNAAPEAPENAALSPEERERQRLKQVLARIDGDMDSSLLADQGPVHLVEGQAPESPTFDAGVFRIRAVPPAASLKEQPRGDREVLVALEVLRGPTIQAHRVVHVAVHKAVDDQGQVLSQALSFGAPPQPEVQMMAPAAGFVVGQPVLQTREVGLEAAEDLRQAAVRLRAEGDRPREIRELEGTLTVMVETPPQPLFTVDGLPQTVGQTFRRGDGATLKVVEVSGGPNGRLTVRLQLDRPDQGPGVVGGPAGLVRMVRVGGGGVLVQEMVDGEETFSLASAEGWHYRVTNTEGPTPVAETDGSGQEYTLTFLPPPRHAGHPDKLVFTARRTLAVNVPFTLHNIPLP